MDTQVLLELVAAMAVAAFGVFQGSKFYTETFNRRKKWATSLVAIVVRYVWRHYVKTTKEASPDGKLTLEQSNEARARARAKTREAVSTWFGKNAHSKAGLQELMKDDVVLDGLIEEAVSTAKALGKGTAQ